MTGATYALADEPGRPDAAFGITTVGVPPVPSVVSEDGTPVRKSLARTGLGTGVFSLSAQQGRAEASVAGLDVAGLVKADVVRTWCADGEGGLEIVGGAVLGHPLPRTPLGDDTIGVSGLVKIELNHQVANVDGSLTVEGITFTVLPGAPAHAGAHRRREVRPARPRRARAARARGRPDRRGCPRRRCPPGARRSSSARRPATGSRSSRPPTRARVRPAAPKPHIVTAHLPVTG